jgi:hypothetical protein
LREREKKAVASGTPRPTSALAPRANFFSFDESAAMIRKVGDKYVVFSEKGKRLSKPMSKEKAKKRLRQIEFFKHRG